MTSEALMPQLPFHASEVGQGYFVRSGYYHACVPVSSFIRYAQVDRVDFRNGTAAFVDRMAALAGLQAEDISFNTLSTISDDLLLLRGEQLGLPVVRRTFVRFCPQCFREDGEGHTDAGSGVQRFQWVWLLRPVVICARHRVVLAELPAPDAVKAFDLQKLIAEQDFKLPKTPQDGTTDPGPLQTYVEDRLWGTKTAAAWLDGQGIAPSSKACEMLGALVEGGPGAPIGSYSELDWARAGDTGFQICSRGPEAILNVLGQLRIRAGRSSGRAGPQAAYGFLFNWLNCTQRSKDFGPLRQIVRDAIVDNFAIGPGEIILGEEISQRRVHSVNSLVAATGINRFRLYRVMRKTGIIPETADTVAFNQWVFPAHEGERLITRIQNSIPLNQVKHALGCSTTQAEQLAQHGLITSVVPISEGRVGLTRGHFNRNDLSALLTEVLLHTVVTEVEEEGYIDLTAAARPLSSTAEILRWHLDGKLTATRLLSGTPRLDHLRFNKVAVRALVTERRSPDLRRLTSVAIILGIRLDAVKRLIAPQNGGPWLAKASAHLCAELDGGAYVSLAEIERFLAEYATLAVIARQVGIHACAVKRLLRQRNIQPRFDPVWLGSHIYRQSDVAGFMAEHVAIDSPENTCGNHAVSNRKAADFDENGMFGESDDVIL